MATESVQQGEKIFSGEENEAEATERKDYEATYDAYNKESKPCKLTNF